MAELTKDVIDTIIAEAVGDGQAGMTAVAWAIANRAAKSGTSPDAVVKKPSQFEGYSNPGQGVLAAQRDPRIRAQVEQIWSGVQNRTIPDPLEGGTMFHASSISPYWADAENKHGTVKIGGQTYYKGGHALPPGELPSVGTLTDTVRPAPLPPVTASPNLATLRGMTSPTGGDSGLQSALDRMATARRNSVTPEIRRPDLPAPALTEQSRLHPFDAAINQPRPNADGSISTEVTRTVQFPDGSWGNVPSLWWGNGSSVRDLDAMDDDQLAEFAARYERQTGQNFPRFSNLQQAEQAAQSRSDAGAGTKGLITRPSLPAMGTPDVASIYRGIFPQADLTQAGQIDRSVASAAGATDSALAAALQRRVATPSSKPVTPLPTGVAQSYAGQTDKPSQPSRSMFSGDPGTPAPGRVVAVLPTRKLSSAPVSYAAQDAVRSPVGQPPATRKVQSVAMPAPARAQTYAAQDAVPSPRSAAVPSGVTRIASIAGSVPMPAGVRPVVPSTQAAKPQQTELQRQAAIYARGGPTRPTSAPVIPDRLAASAGLPALYGAISPAQVNRTGVALTEQVNPAGQRVTAPAVQVARNIAPVPLPASARPTAVGTQLDVAQPLPLARPVLGAAPIPQAGKVAPTPMPRLQRPGIFGRPQIFGHDINLPGVFGVLQNATMAMNNASGPFNNGGDNALYNLMRGGDFNTPGAATHQGRSGYLFAARPGGGFINVGRADPNISAANLYASKLRRNEAADDGANRVNGSRNPSDGVAQSLTSR